MHRMLVLGSGPGLLAALLYYALPMVGHFSFADMKIDNAVFFVGTLAVLAVLHALFPPLSGRRRVMMTLRRQGG
jgi:hypothetical protein